MSRITNDQPNRLANDRTIIVKYVHAYIYVHIRATEASLRVAERILLRLSPETSTLYAETC